MSWRHRTVRIPWLVASYDTQKNKRWLTSNPRARKTNERRSRQIIMKMVQSMQQLICSIYVLLRYSISKYIYLRCCVLSSAVSRFVIIMTWTKFNVLCSVNLFTAELNLTIVVIIYIFRCKAINECKAFYDFLRTNEGDISCFLVCWGLGLLTCVKVMNAKHKTIPHI